MQQDTSNSFLEEGGGYRRGIWLTLLAITSPFEATPKGHLLKQWNTIWRRVNQGTPKGWSDRMAPSNYDCAQFVQKDETLCLE